MRPLGARPAIYREARRPLCCRQCKHVRQQT